MKAIKYKLIYIICILLSASSIIIAYHNPMQGYELSIYNSTPLSVWISLFLSILGSLSIVIYQVYKKEYNINNYWVLGVLILLWNRLIILYIPYIRGYFCWRGDNISHIGHLISIIQNGNVSFENYYPITHLFLATLNTIASIPIEIMVNYTTAMFSVFYVVLIYLLAKSILHSKMAQILTITSIAVVFFSYNLYLTPNGWSQLYLPLILFLYFKSLEKANSFQYTILYVILLIMYPFFHPLSSLYIILILLIITITTIVFDLYPKYYSKLENKNLHSANMTHIKKMSIPCIITSMKNNLNYIKSIDHIPLTAILIELIIFIMWILSFKVFHKNINSLYNSILTGTSLDTMGSMQDTLNKLNITGFDFLELLIKIEGANLIFLSLFGFSLVLLIKNKYNTIKNKNIIIMSVIICFTGLIYASYLFGIVPGLHAIAAERIKSYILIFTPVFAGILFCYYFQKKIYIKTINIIPILCVLIIISASMLSIFNLFPDPYTKRPTLSITEMDIKGTEWFVHYHNQEILTTHVMSPMFRFTDGVIGIDKSNDVLGSKHRHINAPDHFNYTVHKNLGMSYSEDRYMMITKFDTIIYDTVWAVVNRFDSEDFNKLDKDDDSVRKLYSNGETVIYYINII